VSEIGRTGFPVDHTGANRLFPRAEVLHQATVKTIRNMREDFFAPAARRKASMVL
jgi:hypothetical protein